MLAGATDAYSAPLDADRFRLAKTFSVSHNSLRNYREHGIEYLVTSSRMRARFAAEPDRYEINLKFYDRAQRKGTLICEVTPIPWERTGPAVSVYEIPGAQASP